MDRQGREGGRADGGGYDEGGVGTDDVAYSSGEFSPFVLVCHRFDFPFLQVYGVVTLGDESFIYLEDLPGSLLSNKWHTLSQPRLEHVFLNLRHVLHVLSTTYAPANTPVGAIGGSNLHALARRDEDWEPRTSPPVLPSSAALESWLHDLFLAGRQRFVSVKRQEAKWRRNITSKFNLSSPLVLVHGDFQAHNILIDDEGQITGLIDWEYGGWYPAWVETFPAAVALRQGAGPKTARLAEEVFGAAGMPLHSYRALIELHVAVRAALYSVIS